MNRSERWLLMGALAVNDAYVLVRNVDRPPYDDAYFFKRFALNFLHHGRFAWNQEDGPVHGITSQLFQGVATCLTALAPGHYVVLCKLFLAICLFGGAWLFAELADRFTRRTDITAGLTLYVFGCPLVLWTIHTGMETSLAFVVLLLGFRTILDPRPRKHHAVEAAGLTLLAYLCRPDIALLPCVTFVAANVGDRRRLAVYAASLAVLLGALLVVLRVYYGTALPLPFYMKTMGFAPYDEAFRQIGAHEKLVHLTTFVTFALPLAFLSRPRGDARSLGLVLASALFVLFHVIATDEIMGFRARFYVPALVPLGLSAALGASRALAVSGRRLALGLGAFGLIVGAAYRFHVIPYGTADFLDRIPWQTYLGSGAMLGWLALTGNQAATGRAALAGALVLFGIGSLASLPPRRSAVIGDHEFLEKSSAAVTTTRGIFDVERCLPGLKTLYHSEIGVPGLALPDARVIDFAGLMSLSLALEHPRFDDYCRRDRPEVIFLPHRNYADLNDEITRSACLRDYTRMVQQSSSPLYVRNDLVEKFSACAREIQAWQ